MALLSDYAHLYSTNTIPNFQEAEAIQREVHDLKSRIASLQSQLHQYEAVISPVRRIPVEVLGEIFSLSLPVTLDKWGRDQLLDFCLVCKPWRDAALAARWIWASVDVDTDQISYAFEKIVSWLNRAGDTAKSLHVATKDVEWDPDMAGSCTQLGSGCRLEGAVLAKLLTDGPILDRLRFFGKGSDCFRHLVEAMHVYSAFSKPRNRPWDCLRSLELWFASQWNESKYSEWESILRDIPSSVTALTLLLPKVYSFDDEDELPDIPLYIPSEILRRLTSVEFISPRSWSGQTLELLRNCQNVETLRLVIIRDLHPQDPDSVSSTPLRPTIRLPMLRTFRLIMPFTELIQTTSLLETPNLTTLDLMPHSDTSGFAEAVLSFVSRSTCHNTFRHLIVHDCPSTEGELADLLRGLPLITHLTLKSVPGNVIQRAFEILSTPGTTAPHPLHFQLEVLELLELPEPFELYLIRSSLPRHSRPGGLIYVDVNQEPIFNSLKKLVVTHQPMQLPFQRHQGFHDSDWDPEVRALRDSGMLINVGPWEYDDPVL